MKKLLQGILDFRSRLRPELKEKFARLALGQSPDALFVTCSDSRVAVNVFASTDPGDLFVIRNVGNLVPCCDSQGVSLTDSSGAAAVEFAVETLKVAHIIVCGHSECGAMQALAGGLEKVGSPNLHAWLENGKTSLESLERNQEFGTGLSRPNRLSQLNVLEQLNHLRGYPCVRKGLAQGSLSLHGWWFDLKEAAVHAYSDETGRFDILDEAAVARILARTGAK